MRLLFVRPPKYLWPYLNEQDNFLLPQAVVYLGAQARLLGHEIKIIDCMAEKTGWGGIEKVIREFKPDAVLSGDSETLYAHETGHLFQLVKNVSPKIKTIAGGVHFSHACTDAFSKYPIDVIVRGEGEVTLGKALQAMEESKAIHTVPGLALPDERGGAFYTPHAELIEDLDTLPFPAYDLMPMQNYGKAKYLFSPGGITIHHSRGCIANCSFCACWLQMARRKGEMPDEVLMPRWRTRSVLPVVDEMEILAKDYNKNCLVFVDDTWNASAKWGEEFASEIMKRRLKVVWFAFMREDFIARDEASGLFEKLVASGLRHICVGLERDDDVELENLDKHNINIARIKDLFPRLRKKYPSLFIQTTFIVGLPQDTKESLTRMLSYVEKLDPDYPAFHPITPVPGTAMWEQAKESGNLKITDYSRYDWMTPVMDTRTMTRDELEQKVWEMNKKYMSVSRLLPNLFSLHTYRRRMYLWWLLVSLRILSDYVLDRILPSRSIRRKAELSDYIGLIKPDWYDD